MPLPYRRLLSDEELKLCRDTGHRVVLKDVSCGIATIRRRVRIVKDTGFHIINANAAIACETKRSGSRGFAGVFTNIHPDLYVWLQQNRDSHDPPIPEPVNFLALSACIESIGYPGSAKRYHQRLGIFQSAFSRVLDCDLRERHWAIDELLDHIQDGNFRFRTALGLAT